MVSPAYAQLPALNDLCLRPETPELNASVLSPATKRELTLQVPKPMDLGDEFAISHSITWPHSRKAGTAGADLRN